MKGNALKGKLSGKLLGNSSANTPLPSLSKRKTVHPLTPARTRFAPSPTGVLHLGSLRTALYNYLLARQTKGQFIIRLEDTDQKRLVPGAEQNIYDSLAWAGLTADESPAVGGPYGPYRQSERGEIYRKYAELLIERGLAYKCFCSKDRLLSLRETAKKLKPPTTVTYDRKCLHHSSNHAEQEYVIRFRSPDKYEKIEDLRHGILDLQPQYNLSDRRFDDFVIFKLDGLPTYHFANVVDDHLMKITHVIRGEEWLTSTPKHVALYRAFDLTPPKFVHIPLLTNLEDKKLSKRQGDLGIASFSERGIVPAALLNYVALFGWSAPRPEKGKKVTEVMSLDEIVDKFRLDNMTKGNVKVSDKKLWFFNKHHLLQTLKIPEQNKRLIDQELPNFIEKTSGAFDEAYFRDCLRVAAGHLEKISDLVDEHPYFFLDVNLPSINDPNKLQLLATLIEARQISRMTNTFASVDAIKAATPDLPPAKIMQSLRFALTGMVPGVNIVEVQQVIGFDTYNRRLDQAIEFLQNP